MVINVIDPMVKYVAKHYAGRKVGLIGTRRTIEAKAPNVSLSSLATPLLAHAIEEGFIHDNISLSLIQEYLGHGQLDGIEALILGCTHYPLIKEEVNRFYEGQIDILDSAEITARELQARLTIEAMLEESSTDPDKFLVSDYTPDFEHSTKLFFGTEVHLEEHRLWE